MILRDHELYRFIDFESHSFFHVVIQVIPVCEVNPPYTVWIHDSNRDIESVRDVMRISHVCFPHAQFTVALLSSSCDCDNFVATRSEAASTEASSSDHLGFVLGVGVTSTEPLLPVGVADVIVGDTELVICFLVVIVPVIGC